MKTKTEPKNKSHKNSDLFRTEGFEFPGICSFSREADNRVPAPRTFDLLDKIEKNIRKSLDEYMEYLLEYNKKVNLISRQMKIEELRRLVSETILLEKYISGDTILDAGSGNGLLGIPIALLNPDKKIVLVETKAKKAEFLEKAKTRLELTNVRVFCSSIEEYIKKHPEKGRTLVTRGFPVLEAIVNFVKKGLVKEAVLITSENKLKKIKIDMVNTRKKTYNVPLRKNLKILKMENVSRET
ncbi:MAG: class I SAM-dependent methyltransferase [Candidatus Aminicenantes bacterium]|nr:class I SAM-dependent methyltransferase [Candidatus Aminicenantes bacterium]